MTASSGEMRYLHERLPELLGTYVASGLAEDPISVDVVVHATERWLKRPGRCTHNLEIETAEKLYPLPPGGMYGVFGGSHLAIYSPTVRDNSNKLVTIRQWWGGTKDLQPMWHWIPVETMGFRAASNLYLLLGSKLGSLS